MLPNALLFTLIFGASHAAWSFLRVPLGAIVAGIAKATGKMTSYWPREYSSAPAVILQPEKMESRQKIRQFAQLFT
jgi:hypothetical protein